MTEPSPRTASEPMAFTRTEFWQGLTSAWLWSLPLLLVPWAVFLGYYAVVAVLYIVPWSVGATLAFGAPAYFLGRVLRRIPRVPVHLTAFAVLGAVVGAATTGVLFVVDPSLRQAMGAMILTVNVAGSALAVTVGWWRTARRALRAEARPALAEPADPDAAAEDALLDGSGSTG